jgi:16S rRNA (cytosine1402-N4)-methyltransferase
MSPDVRKGGAGDDARQNLNLDAAATPLSDHDRAAGGHIPVMLREVVAALAPRDGGVYLDGTFGGGGYAAAILTAAPCVLWAIDRDPAAISRGAGLAARFPGRLHLLQGRFGEMLSLLDHAGVATLDGVVLDLGVSSYQIDDPARGFSFRHDGPLDMRMGNHGTTAADLVNSLPEKALADVLYDLGEERASRRIARAIVAARSEAPIETTGRLASIVRSVLPPDRSGNHPATRSFQALRIRVNDELGEIERALDQAIGLLSPGGRLVVVSFHSLEDRIVKRFMGEAAGRAPSPSRHDPRGLTARPAAGFRLVASKALRPSALEVSANPRARSARLRALERLHTATIAEVRATP